MPECFLTMIVTLLRDWGATMLSDHDCYVTKRPKIARMLSDRDCYLTKRLGCQKLLSDRDCYFTKRLECQNAF